MNLIKLQMSELYKFPLQRRCPMSPPPEYAAMRADAPLTKVQLWDGSFAWLITRFDDVKAALRDDRFSACPTNPDFPALSPTKDALYANEPRTFFRMDPPEHGPYRAMVAGEFTAKAIRDLYPEMEKIAEELIDKMIAKGPPCDFMKDFSDSLPSQVVSKLLGVPYEDHDYFEQRSIARLDIHSDTQTVLTASREMLAYIDRLLTKREKEPGEDLLSRLVVEQIRPGKLSHADAVAVGELLLRGGHETTSTQIAMGLLTLFRHPDQFALLKADPGLLRGAIEEMLRFNTIVHFVGARFAVADVEIGGQLIRKGEGIYALISSANRDGDMFPEPDTFDIRRKNNYHIAFGFGPHVCVGQQLARAEMAIAFSALLRRLPNLSLATPYEDIAFKSESFIYGPANFSISW